LGLHIGDAPHQCRIWTDALHQRRQAIARRDAGEALTDIARTYGVSHTRIGRLTAAPAP
jgi:hypothetical protein